jgi:hypothetical protein
VKEAGGGMNKNRKDFHHRIRLIVAGIALALIMAGICTPAGAGAGGQKIKGEWILPEYYPQGGFDGYGYVNRIAAAEVVIDDSIYRLSPAATYATLSSVMATIGDFVDGDLVGYLTNSEQEIISLWLIKKGNS